MKFLVLFFALSIAFNRLLAQESAPPAKQTAETTPPAGIFKARAQLVLIPVIVNDKSGAHVSGLAGDAFRLEENGKARDISLFEEVLPPKNATTQPKLAKDSAANFLGSSLTPTQFTIVVLDLINTPYLKQTEGRRHLIEFLARGLPPNQPVTLLGLSYKGIVQLHSFTTDTQVLIDAVKKLESSLAPGEVSDAEAREQTNQNADLADSMTSWRTGESADEIAQQITQFMQDATDTIALLQQKESTRRTLAALNQIAEAYSGTRSRKTLIWATSGFPFLLNDPRAFTHLGSDMVEQYQQTWRALTAANIAVYPVELVGLDSRVVDASQSRGSYNPTRSRRGNPMGTSAALPYDQNEERQDTLKAFADSTGGRPCLNTNEFKKCFAEAVEDSQSYYLVGYYLPTEDDKPGWRTLKVHVKAQDAHVRAREGFYVAPQAENTTAVRRQELVTALSSPFEYTGIVMDVKSSTAEPIDANGDTAPRKLMQDFLVHIPISSLVIDASNKNRLDLEIAAVALDRSGKDVSRFSQGVQVSFNPDMLARVQKTGVALKESLELIPGKYECRFVVRDNQSGQIGTVHLLYEAK